MAVLLNRGKFYAITKPVEGSVAVQKSDKGRISSNVVGSDEETIIGIADEQITLYDGKVLSRVKNNLIIE